MTAGNLFQEFGYIHLSAGELLREERASGSKDGDLIESCMKDGKIVPVKITISLIEKVCVCILCLIPEKLFVPTIHTLFNSLHIFTPLLLYNLYNQFYHDFVF